MTLVLDVNAGLIVTYSVETGVYELYRQDRYDIARAEILAAEEVVTFNGTEYDLQQKIFSSGSGQVELTGTHTDVMQLCWLSENSFGKRPCFGKGLSQIYLMFFPDQAVPIWTTPDNYEQAQLNQVFKTWQLWQLWRQGELTFLD